jgi:hypothetical protein
MKKAFLCALVLALGLTTGCVKTTSEAAVKADGSATVKMSARYLISSIEKMKSVPDDCTCWKVYQIHELSVPAARRGLLAFEGEWDGRRVSDRWARLGLNVTKSSVSESDGWRVIDLEASTANVADYHAKLAAELKAAAKEEYLTAIPWYLHTRRLLPKLPRFYKTSDPTVVKAVVEVADVGAQIDALADLTPDERTILEKQLTYMKALRTFKQGEIKVLVRLPGTVVSVTNAKQDGTDGLSFDLKGDEVEPETVAAQAKAKGLITATFKVDPKTFTMPLVAE